jgi:hypothetical protein
MEICRGKLISADFEESTMEFEIQHEFVAKTGEYAILRKEDFEKLISCFDPKDLKSIAPGLGVWLEMTNKKKSLFNQET